MKMFYVKRSISVLLFMIICWKDCLACFRNDEHKANVIATGNTYYQECYCTEPGYDARYLKWVDNENKIITEGPGTDSKIYVERQTDSLNLHIPSFSKSMSGPYKCITNFEGQQYVQTYTIEAYDPLYIFNAPENQILLEEHDSRINCEVRGEFKPIITWHKGQDASFEIIPSEKYEITQEGLIVKRVTKDDAGIYRCTALGVVTGEEVDRFIKAEVMTLPIIKGIIPIPEATVVEGENLSLECLANGTPHPEYSWNKLIVNETEDRNQTWRQVVNTIIFDEIRAEDNGTYECTAFNIAGNVTSTISIEVLVPPVITSFENMTVEEGVKYQMLCNATGKPEPNITLSTRIFKNVSDDGESYGEYIENGIIFTADRFHTGRYYCNATNDVASVGKEMYMTVLHKPFFDDPNEYIWGWKDKTVNLSCASNSNPSAITTWRFQGNDIPTAEQVEISKQLIETLNNIADQYLPVNIDKNFSYGVYECVAKNVYGEAKKTVTVRQAFVPPPINNANIDYVTATSVLFSILGPEHVEGPDVVGFIAQYDEAPNYNITNIHANRTWSIDRPYKLEKLKPNMTYYVRFAAINDVGAGPWTELLGFNTLEKSVPEAPVFETEFLQVATTNYVLKWKEPDDNGDSVDYYAVLYCPEPNGEIELSLCKEEQVITNELQLSNLDLNTTYYLSILAHNAQGNSSATNITLVTAEYLAEESIFSAGAIIGLAVVVVVVCLILLDLVLLVWKRKGVIASCCCKKSKNKEEDSLQSRDKKGLLRDGEADSSTRSNKGHKEYEYNKTTGIITGKHSAV